MDPLKKRWARKGYGMGLGAGAEKVLLNLRFADDLLLVAKSTDEAGQAVKSRSGLVPTHRALPLTAPREKW